MCKNNSFCFAEWFLLSWASSSVRSWHLASCFILKVRSSCGFQCFCFHSLFPSLISDWLTSPTPYFTPLLRRVFHLRHSPQSLSFLPSLLSLWFGIVHWRCVFWNLVVVKVLFDFLQIHSSFFLFSSFSFISLQVKNRCEQIQSVCKDTQYYSKDEHATT